jgi:hypothetical protein
LMETVVRLFGSSRSFHSRLIKKHFIGHDDCRVLGRASGCAGLRSARNL